MKSVSRPRAEAFKHQTLTEEFQYLTRKNKVSGRKKEPVKIHSWNHSYPHSKVNKKAFQPYIEINGKGRTWRSVGHIESEIGTNYELVYRGCLGVWEVVDAEPIDCS
jgi:hypothetical protein